jgi:formylglycine-generating enzyme required for sulfatase activity
MVWVPPSATIPGFFIDQYENIVDLTTGLCNEDQISANNHLDGSTTAVAVSRPGVTPLVWVSWYQARAACINAGKRLCTVNQLERACRGDDGRHYPYGDTYTSGACNTNGTTIEPTAHYMGCASVFGVYDLVGNVAEWSARDPDDPQTAHNSGGSWSGTATCGSVSPIGNPAGTDGTRGFRCCMDAP